MNKTELLKFLRRETATTLRVMRAFPADQGAFRPHERSSDAMLLMKTFVFEMYLTKSYVLGDEPDMSLFQTYAPESVEAVIADFEKESGECATRLEELDEATLGESVEFAGRLFGRGEFLHMMICDQVHHRGQLSVYVRMAGGLVPSIYGPSADDDGTNL